HPQAAHAGDAAAVGLLRAREEAQERGLAGPVGADDADAVAVVQAERDVVEQGAGADGQRDAVGAEEMSHTVERSDLGGVLVQGAGRSARPRVSARWGLLPLAPGRAMTKGDRDNRPPASRGSPCPSTVPTSPRCAGSPTRSRASP